MAKIKGAIVVDTERCKGCNLCVVACPLDVIALNKEVNMKGYNYAWQVKEAAISRKRWNFFPKEKQYSLVRLSVRSCYPETSSKHVSSSGSPPTNR